MAPKNGVSTDQKEQTHELVVYYSSTAIMRKTEPVFIPQVTLISNS